MCGDDLKDIWECAGKLWSLWGHTRIGGIDFIRNPFLYSILNSPENQQRDRTWVNSFHIIVVVVSLFSTLCWLWVRMFLFCCFGFGCGEKRSIIISWFRLELTMLGLLMFPPLIGFIEFVSVLERKSKIPQCKSDIKILNNFGWEEERSLSFN